MSSKFVFRFHCSRNIIGLRTQNSIESRSELTIEDSNATGYVTSNSIGQLHFSGQSKCCVLQCLKLLQNIGLKVKIAI
jgi:hypothetical protein